MGCPADWVDKTCLYLRAPRAASPLMSCVLCISLVKGVTNQSRFKGRGNKTYLLRRRGSKNLWLSPIHGKGPVQIEEVFLRLDQQDMLTTYRWNGNERIESWRNTIKDKRVISAALKRNNRKGIYLKSRKVLCKSWTIQKLIRQKFWSIWWSHPGDLFQDVICVRCL